jgi:hypothetical protein
MFVVELEVAGLVDRVDEDGRGTANGAHGGDQVASGHPGNLRCHPEQDRRRQMTQHTIEAEGDVYRAACFRHPVRQIRDIESQAHAREPGQVIGDAPCGLNLRVGDIETSGRDVREPQLPCLSHDTPQPRARPAAGVDNADGGCARRPQPAQPLADYPSDPPVGIGVRSLESEQAPGIAIGIVEIIVARSVVDRRDVRLGRLMGKPTELAIWVLPVHVSAGAFGSQSNQLDELDRSLAPAFKSARLPDDPVNKARQ